MSVGIGEYRFQSHVGRFSGHGRHGYHDILFVTKNIDYRYSETSRDLIISLSRVNNIFSLLVCMSVFKYFLTLGFPKRSIERQLTYFGG